MRYSGQQIYEAGKDARLSGYSVGSCPFPLEEYSARLVWIRGWVQENNDLVDIVTLPRRMREMRK